ncbi:MAG: ankyrin repeat domain-containing protein [Verrucomicrobiales bacterium]
MADPVDSFVASFLDADLERARAVLGECLDLLPAGGYQAHPLLRRCVAANGGRCHRAGQLQIAELLLPEEIGQVRDLIVGGEVAGLQRLLSGDPALLEAEFTAGRGIGRPIHHWVELGLGEVLVAAGADLGALNSLGESALAMQCRFGSVAGLRLLLAHGADPNLGQPGHPPSGTMEERIGLLLAHGWKLDSRLMLHDAKHGHGERVRVWLSHGADPNAQMDDGRTALHLFAGTGKGEQAIRSLVAAGAQIDVVDPAGNTPLDIARQAACESAARTLSELAASP